MALRVDAVPQRSAYDVVIVGGAIMGSSTAWFLAENPDFDGTVLVVERDPSFEACSTAHTNSCSSRHEPSVRQHAPVGQGLGEQSVPSPS